MDCAYLSSYYPDCLWVYILHLCESYLLGLLLRWLPTVRVCSIVASLSLLDPILLCHFPPSLFVHAVDLTEHIRVNYNPITTLRRGPGGLGRGQCPRVWPITAPGVLCGRSQADHLRPVSEGVNGRMLGCVSMLEVWPPGRVVVGCRQEWCCYRYLSAC